MACKCDTMYMLLKEKLYLIIQKTKFENVNMVWYDLKLWQIFRTKHKICAFSKIPISSNLIIKKHLTYWGNYKYNI
jgi:hypothetical protein